MKRIVLASLTGFCLVILLVAITGAVTRGLASGVTRDIDCRTPRGPMLPSKASNSLPVTFQGFTTDTPQFQGEAWKA